MTQIGWYNTDCGLTIDEWYAAWQRSSNISGLGFILAIVIVSVILWFTVEK